MRPMGRVHCHMAGSCQELAHNYTRRLPCPKNLGLS